MIGGGGDTRLYGIGVSSPARLGVGDRHADADGASLWSAYGGGWGLRVILVCAEPLPGHRMAYKVGPWPGDSTPMMTTAARCPAGTSVYGVGGVVHWTPTTRSLVINENWTPNASLTAASVTAQEDENSTPDSRRTLRR